MTKITVISDTHGQHMDLQIPDADFLIHCGDFSSHGTYLDAVKFVNWFGAQPHKHKIFIAGNHDLFFEKGNPSDINMFFNTMPQDVYYLNDSGIELEGIKFWGSPVQPRFFNWAFNRDSDEIQKHWDRVPEDTDVLITHGPAKFRVDEAPRNYGRPNVHVGCPKLLDRIKIIKPALHLCGHIHYSYGDCYQDGVHHINASICNESYAPINKPRLLELIGKQVIITNIL